MSDSLALAADATAALAADRRRLVAVDGIDGAGKSTFADSLAPLIERPVVRASTDDFHNPRAVRYRRGRESAEDYYLDSFDLAALTSLLLTPFAAGEPFCRRAFDYREDTPVPAEVEDAPDDAILVLDGLFLHRSALRDRWDLSIWLDVPADIAAERLLLRNRQPPRDRYIRGNELYIAEARPADNASLVLPW
jgi:uridine kinase